MKFKVIALLSLVLTLLMGCKKVEEPFSVLPMVDTTAEGRFVYTPLPTYGNSNVMMGVVLHDKEHNVVCYVVSRTHPTVSCVKL